MLTDYHPQAGGSFVAGEYYWYSLQEALFRTLLTLVPTAPKRFIDAGSGLGDKLWLTHSIFGKSKLIGIEEDHKVAMKSRALLKDHKVPARIITRSVFDYKYNGPDTVIYTFGPAQDLVQSFTRKVLTELGVGSSLIQVCGTHAWQPLIFTRTSKNQFSITFYQSSLKGTKVFKPKKNFSVKRQVLFDWLVQHAGKRRPAELFQLVSIRTSLLGSSVFFDWLIVKLEKDS